jgi:hypothetical protein
MEEIKTLGGVQLACAAVVLWHPVDADLVAQ